MPRYEYKVVPAPAKGTKARGVKTPEARFALSVEDVLNEMGAAGWDYLRAELLPSEERSGLTGSTTQWRNVLVFRRALAAQGEVLDPLARAERAEPPVAPMLAAAAAAPDAGREVPHPAPEPEAGPQAEAPQQPEAREQAQRPEPDVLESIIEAETETETDYYLPPQPEPEQRRPPSFRDMPPPPPPVRETGAEFAQGSEDAPEPLRQFADGSQEKWLDADDASLSGIEKVVRRNARHSAARQDGPDEG